MSETIPENQYYKSIEQYISKKFNCIKTGISKGSLSLGLADVIGVYDTSSEFYNDVELMVVEVKKRTSNFGKSLGQSLGYSIFGERCYLAVTFSDNETFTAGQITMADHLGVGLIRVPISKDGKPKKNQIEIILTSRKHDPILSQKQYLLHSLGVVQCSICKIYGSENKMHRIERKSENRAVFTNKLSRKLYLCDKCYVHFIPETDRKRKEFLIETGKKAAKSRKLHKTSQKSLQTMSNSKVTEEEI